jgi:NAD(P)H dehydrogenase (quinone)
VECWPAGLGDERVAYISRHDIAAAAPGAPLAAGHSGAVYNLTDRATLLVPERAAIVSEIVGKSANYVTNTADQLRASLAQARLPELMVDAMAEIKTSIIGGKSDIVTGGVERLSGLSPKSLSDILTAAPA